MPETVFLCRHIKTNGIPCTSPALRGQNFCYFHNRLHRRHRALRRAAHAPAALELHPAESHPGSAEPLQLPALCPPHPAVSHPLPELTLDLPPLEDAHAVQVSLSLITQAIALGRIDLDRARTLLYALQLASANSRNLRSLFPDDCVAEVTQSKSGIDITA